MWNSEPIEIKMVCDEVNFQLELNKGGDMNDECLLIVSL